MNKYKKWYDDICRRGQTVRKNIHTENHHIVPESFYINRKRKGPKGWVEGNPDAPENKTRLTGREHALAHWLLIKIYPTGKEFQKVIKAFTAMAQINPNQKDSRRRINSRAYEKAKIEVAKIHSEMFSGENNPNYGNNWTDQQKEEQRQKLVGRKQTQEALDNWQAALADRKAKGLKRKGYSDEYKEERSKRYSGEGNPNYGKTASDETKELQRKKATGRKQSKETIKAKADAVRGSKREKKHCIHCDQMIAVNGYARFHGDKCKMKPKIG